MTAIRTIAGSLVGPQCASAWRGMPGQDQRPDARRHVWQHAATGRLSETPEVAAGCGCDCRSRGAGPRRSVRLGTSEKAFQFAHTSRSAGIETPGHALVEVSGRSALIVERFDRVGNLRTPFTSAATIMEEPPHSYASPAASYAALSVMVRRAGIRDCSRDLFRRMLLNCFLNNTDDHPHNHGFICEGGAWRVSPVFDVVTQRKRALVLRPAKGVSTEANPEVAMTAYPASGMDREEAQVIFNGVREAAATFRDWLRHCGTSDADMATIADLAPHAVAAERSARRHAYVVDEPGTPPQP